LTVATWRFVRTADLGANRSEGPLPALHVEMCMTPHLSLSAPTGRSTIKDNAAARPVIAAIRAERSI
jgi:hypothetical protein